MRPEQFPEANCVYNPPPDMDESQVMPIAAYGSVVEKGNLDGARFVTVAWKPNESDLKRLNDGGLVYITMLGGLAPHLIATDFKSATSF